MVDTRDVVILGGGVAGLAAASELGDSAVVLERADRPGGLVRTDCYDGYWFDRVLHILHFQGDAIELRIRDLLGDDLARVPPQAWVETAHGTVRFPFQLHLARLEPRVVARCLRDLAAATFGGDERPPAHFEDMLLRTFGRAMCDAFLLPYNRKMWKRPLDSLAPSGFQWTITHPDFEKVVEGAIRSEASFKAYNSNGWYPRPAASSSVRGMEVLSRALAAKAHDLRLQAEVIAVDPDRRVVTVRRNGDEYAIAWGQACLSTVPLPRLLSMCRGVPADLRRRCENLPRNRVLQAALSVRGPRPRGRGHWRYYGDETLVFTRLVYMHEFDPMTAPPDGWGLMAEITEPAETPVADTAAVLERVRADVVRAGAIGPECEIIDSHLHAIDPAYVVFTPGSRDVVAAARAYLGERGIHTLGRYGRWEYSSMAQVMSDGFEWAREWALT